MKISPPVKALPAQSIPSAPSTKVKRKHLEHADSGSDSDIVITTTPSKPYRKRRTAGGLGSPPLVSSPAITITAPPPHLDDKMEVVPHGAAVHLERAPVDEFWAAYGDSHSGTQLRLAANEADYKMTSCYFLLRLNMIVRGISPDEAKHIFHTLESSFIKRPGSENVKSKCLSLFLRETKYVNKVMHSRVEFYASKWAASLAVAMYKAALQASK